MLFWYEYTSSILAVEDINIARKFQDLEHIFKYNNDTTYVINFWATWCGPCVREMPYFEKLNKIYSNSKFELILVSLDFENHIDNKLLAYLNNKKITSELFVLLDGKENSWIDKVDSQWSGSIPITLIYNNAERLFYEQEFHSTEELTNIINPLIN